MYKVIIVKQNSETAVLHVNRKAGFDDVKTAMRYVKEVRSLIADGFHLFGAVDAYIRDERGAVWL